ncbi:MAG: hypothetical protein R3C03_07320 [Pirellulaceae bacterium]
MSSKPRSAVQRYFAGLAENTFQSELGVVDPPLIDYLSDLLVRFVRSDVVHRIRSVTGKPLMSVGEMVGEATERIGEARSELYRHIGDFTLFWAGVYPEALRDDQTTQFDDYCCQGKRSYHLASQLEIENQEKQEEALVLERLSCQFDLCCYGLREVRRQWETGGGEDGGRVILIG